jgi:hypothetical protein
MSNKQKQEQLPPFQFSLRALVIGGPIVGSMVGLAASMSRDPLGDLLRAGAWGGLAIICLLASFYLAATRSRSATAWCLIAVAWDLVSIGAICDIVSRFTVLGNPDWEHTFDPRFPWWFILQLAVLSVLTFPVVALLTNGRHEPVGGAAKWLLGASILATVDVILLWLSIVAVMLVRIGPEGPDWIGVFW